MSRILELLRSRLRAISRTEWEESTGPRWAGQILAGVIPGLIVLGVIMHFSSQAVSPTVGSRARSAASVVPLLSVAAITDTAAFHRRNVAQEPARAAEFRHPRMVEDLPQAMPLPRPVALPVDFQSPRVAWLHLDTGLRAKIDEGFRAQGQHGARQVVLHGSGQSRGSLTLLSRYQASVHGGASVYDFVIGNGHATRDGVIEVSEHWAVPKTEGGEVHVCLVGDFHRSPPTVAQLAALDELLDYLRIKTGYLPVTVHGNGQCLGSQFPADEVIDAAKD